MINLKIDDNGTIREMTEEEIAEMQIETPIEQQIAELQIKLDETDYKAIKYSEGWLTDEEYAQIKAQRQAWRDEINQLESEN